MLRRKRSIHLRSQQNRLRLLNRLPPHRTLLTRDQLLKLLVTRLTVLFLNLDLNLVVLPSSHLTFPSLRVSDSSLFCFSFSTARRSQTTTSLRENS